MYKGYLPLTMTARRSNKKIRLTRRAVSAFALAYRFVLSNKMSERRWVSETVMASVAFHFKLCSSQ